MNYEIKTDIYKKWLQGYSNQGVEEKHTHVKNKCLNYLSEKHLKLIPYQNVLNGDLDAMWVVH